MGVVYRCVDARGRGAYYRCVPKSSRQALVSESSRVVARAVSRSSQETQDLVNKVSKTPISITKYVFSLCTLSDKSGIKHSHF